MIKNKLDKEMRKIPFQRWRPSYSHFVFIIFYLSFFGSFKLVFSQNQSLNKFDNKDIFQFEGKSITPEGLTEYLKYPIGNIINPDFYYLGPGDILTFQNLSYAPDIQQFLTVTTEISVLIPRIGEISLKDKTLSEAKSLIMNKIKEWNPNALAYISLYATRNVLVTIKGNVIMPGTYSFPASYRISTVLKVVNSTQIKKETFQTQAVALSEYEERNIERNLIVSQSGLTGEYTSSYRDVVLKRNDGSSRIVDIERAFAYNDLNYDPYIKEGDEIIVPYQSDSKPMISLSGAVLNPLSIRYKNGDRASLLLGLGLGFNENADRNNVRLYLPGKLEPIILSVDENMNIIGADYDLEPGSIIIVGQNKYFKDSNLGNVAVTGNVNNPGVYVITNNQTRLKDAIDFAGGLTSKAYLPMSYIYRRTKEPFPIRSTRRELLEAFQYSDLTLEDTVRFSSDAVLKKPYVSCDFVSALEKNSERDNVLLQDGDIIVIASKPSGVYVYGQVNHPGFVSYQDNKPIEWYIERAGGYATGADKSRSRIVRGRTKVWVEPEKDVPIYAGDEIYVPKPPDLPPGIELQKWGAFAAILGATTAVINVLIWAFR